MFWSRSSRCAGEGDAARLARYVGAEGNGNGVRGRTAAAGRCSPLRSHLRGNGERGHAVESIRNPVCFQSGSQGSLSRRRKFRLIGGSGRFREAVGKESVREGRESDSRVIQHTTSRSRKYSVYQSQRIHTDNIRVLLADLR